MASMERHGEHEERSRRRWGILIALAVIVLLLVGFRTLPSILKIT
jgi:hypothetical protein